MRGLAYRRAQDERAYRRLLNVLSRQPYRTRKYPGSFDYEIEHEARVRRNTPTPCSCAMCGNPRKWNGDLTIAELKAIDSAREAMYDHGHVGHRTDHTHEA